MMMLMPIVVREKHSTDEVVLKNMATVTCSLEHRAMREMRREMCKTISQIEINLLLFILSNG